MNRARIHAWGLAAGLLALTNAASVDAQVAPGRGATRAEIEASAQSLELAVASTAYSAELRAGARTELAAVRRRLQEGDFRVGERVAVTVSSGSPIVDTTLTVLDSLILDIPGIRRVRLYGVLHSELQPLLARQVAEVVRDAQVAARPLMRIAVLGAVSQPGFLQVPSDLLVDQLLTAAGNPTAQAQVRRMRFMRGDTVLVDGPETMAAITEARTLTSLDLRDGDVLMVPQAGAPWDRATTLQIIGTFVMPIVTILVLNRP